jgi:hypothetical protein
MNVYLDGRKLRHDEFSEDGVTIGIPTITIHEKALRGTGIGAHRIVILYSYPYHELVVKTGIDDPNEAVPGKPRQRHPRAPTPPDALA